MKTVFDHSVRNELTSRIARLNGNSTALWGKMNVYQMARHCRQWEQWIAKPNPRPQSFVGRIFGKMALKNVLKNDAPLRRNTPTSPIFRITEQSGDLQREKDLWIEQLNKYAAFSNPDFVHDFFGKMTKEQIGQVAYKHNDHHLRQFGV